MVTLAEPIEGRFECVLERDQDTEQAAETEERRAWSVGASERGATAGLGLRIGSRIDYPQDAEESWRFSSRNSQARGCAQ